MRWSSISVVAFLLATSTPALADPMIGFWRSRTGLIASVAKCGASLCITLRNKEYAGRMIGRMKGANGQYSGSVVHPGWNWTFNGFAELNGDTTSIRGCVVGRVFCRSQVWRRYSGSAFAGR